MKPKTMHVRRAASALIGIPAAIPAGRGALALYAIGIALLALPAMGRLWWQSRVTIDRPPPPVRYAITNLGSAEGRFSRVDASSINNRGQVTGHVTMSKGGLRAFLWEKGRFTVLPGPEGGGSSGRQVNNHGEVVGWFWKDPGFRDEHVVIFRGEKVVDLGISGYGSGIDDKSRVVGRAEPSHHAFLCDGGKTIDLGTLGGAKSSASGINNRAQIVGTSELVSGHRHAFLYSNGMMHDLGTLGGRESLGFAINSKGWVVGVSTNEWDWREAFLYRNGKMEEMEHGWSDYDIPHAINAAGTVVGVEWSELEQLGAIAWINGHAYNLQDLIPPDSGWKLGSAEDINDRGQIVAYGSHAGEQGLRSCILTPVVKSPTRLAGSRRMLRSSGTSAEGALLCGCELPGSV